MGQKAKKFFQEIRNIDKQIDVKFEQLERAKALATKVTATMSDTPGRATGGDGESSWDKVIRLRDELDAEIDRLVDMKREAMGIVRKLQNEKYRRVLESRYLVGKTWEAIAVEMGMTYQGVCKMHGAALQEAEKIFAEILAS